MAKELPRRGPLDARHLGLLHEVCSLPTAPFAERFVVEFIERFVAARKRLRLSRDVHGNLLIEAKSAARSRRPRWVFAAHMDHPGFVARKAVKNGVVEADFRGWVHIDYVRGAKVRFFNSDGTQVRGVVIEATPHEYDRLTVPAKALVRVGRPQVEPGAPGMFDQGGSRTRGGRFYSRACDDLAGAAAALAMLDELLRAPAPSPVAVLLTRAEEEGFIGAIAAARRPALLRKSDRLIAIECSAEQPVARQGAGAIVRVGDKTSIFNSDLTWFVTQQAEALAEEEPGFHFQRALMPGGTCEATVYDVYGFMAASICVALGNYHNMDRARKRIGPEYIDVGDWQNMVRLFLRLARHGHAWSPGHAGLRGRIEQRFDRLKHLLREST